MITVTEQLEQVRGRLLFFFFGVGYRSEFDKISDCFQVSSCYVCIKVLCEGLAPGRLMSLAGALWGTLYGHHLLEQQNIFFPDYFGVGGVT